MPTCSDRTQSKNEGLVHISDGSKKIRSSSNSSSSSGSNTDPTIKVNTTTTTTTNRNGIVDVLERG